MATKSLPKQYAEALICPSCESQRLIPTKEKIIICRDCLTGYRVLNGVPDFNLDRAISFKNKMGAKKKGVNAVLSILMGQNKDDTYDIQYGHCVIMGRKINPQLNMEMTMVTRPQNHKAYSSLDPHNQQLIERYLSQHQNDVLRNDQFLASQKKFLGNFVREPDFLLDDPSISRTHAVIYQDENGLNVLDLCSKNGTYVNGYEVESCRLRHGDVISLGTASMKVSLY